MPTKGNSRGKASNVGAPAQHRAQERFRKHLLDEEQQNIVSENVILRARVHELEQQLLKSNMEFAQMKVQYERFLKQQQKELAGMVLRLKF